MLLNNRKVYRQTANNPKLRITDKLCVLSSIFNRFCLSSILLILFTGCINRTIYHKIEFSYKNPTKYCFDYPYKEVKKVIQREFDSSKFQHHRLEFKNTVNTWDEGKEIYKEIANKNDALLVDGFYGYGSESFIYYDENDNPMGYSSTYQIHVNSTSENQTCLEIITINPRVKIGVFREFVLDHAMDFQGEKYISVEPSTIEEYEILYLIGHKLGQNNMPDLIYPDSIPKQKHCIYHSLFKRLE